MHVMQAPPVPLCADEWRAASARSSGGTVKRRHGPRGWVRSLLTPELETSRASGLGASVGSSGGVRNPQT